MAYTINTNIASLQSQEYLRISSEFQQRTINRVTSGLRIISSGDDAAGLAIANSFRSDRAVLIQGVRNINDGISNLQTIDGGLNNISQLLDRARTLAAQSASGTFTGERAVLNSEFQSVIDEIDRQSQAIGLNVGGLLAKNLGVFIGGGRGSTAADQISNGSVDVDLSTATVDARSLGLKGLQIAGARATDVDQILGDATNIGSVTVPGFTDFYFRGPGFADQNRALAFGLLDALRRLVRGRLVGAERHDPADHQHDHADERDPVQRGQPEQDRHDPSAARRDRALRHPCNLAAAFGDFAQTLDLELQPRDFVPNLVHPQHPARAGCPGYSVII